MQELKKLIDADAAAAFFCRKHLWFFVKEFWDIIVPNDLVWNWHMKVLCDELQAADERVFLRQPKEKDLIFNVPPGTSKTKIISILSTAWEFCRMPEIKVFVGSYSDAAITGISDEIRLVMKSGRYRRYFPNVILRKDRDTMHNFKTTVNGEFYAFTVGGSLTSKHADILKVDDPLNPKMAASEDQLKNVNAFFSQTLPSRKVDKEVTLSVLIMQRLNENDPSGYLLNRDKENIEHICLPGEISDNVKPKKYSEFYEHGLLDEIRLSRKELMRLERELGPYGYAGQIGQRPVPEGGLIWRREWFHEVPDSEFPDIRDGDYAGNDWDLAYTKKETNAASAYIKSFRIGGKIFIDDFNWQWLEFPELINWMKSISEDHYIEAKASGISAKQTLTKEGIIALEVKVKGGADKIARAKMSSPSAASGLCYIRKSMADRFFTDKDQGILFFPNGKYADLADCLSQCLQRHRTIGNKYLSETKTEDEADLLNELDY